MNGSLTDTSCQPWGTFYPVPSENGQQPVALFAKQLAAQLQTPRGEVSPSLQPPRRRQRVLGAGGCGGLRYPLCGMLRPAMPSGRRESWFDSSRLPKSVAVDLV